MKAIIHAKAVCPAGVIENCVILYDQAKILSLGTDIKIPDGAEVIDAQGHYVGPGFVDIHVHGNGCGNKWWYEAPEEVGAYHLKHGSTGMVAYLGYDMSKEDIITGTAYIQEKLDQGLIPNCYGLGFEGPYINPHQGAGSGCARKAIDPDEYTRLYEACHGHILQWMYAPEMDKDGTFGDFLREKRITTAVGHSEASPAQIRAAVDKGATIATHLFDAMGNHQGNNAWENTGTAQDGVAVGCLICPELTYEIIPDSKGLHVMTSNMKLVYQLAGARRIAVVTDCCPCNYNCADYPADHIRSATDVNYNEADELAGSILTMDQAFYNFMRHTGCSITDAFLVAATTPAKAIHIDNVTGSLTPGKFADMVILKEDYTLNTVIFHGEIVE